MRLSEAIRLGALISSQVVGTFVRGKAACALGAAVVATGTTAPTLRATWDRWRWAFAVTAPCPVCNLDNGSSVFMLITHLNDDHRWSREQIANWLAAK